MNPQPNTAVRGSTVEFLRAQVASQLWVCVNILQRVSISKAFYRVAVELCVFILGTQYLYLGVLMRVFRVRYAVYTYSSLRKGQPPPHSNDRRGVVPLRWVAYGWDWLHWHFLQQLRYTARGCQFQSPTGGKKNNCALKPQIYRWPKGQKKNAQCRVRKGTGSQSVVVCVVNILEAARVWEASQ